MIRLGFRSYLKYTLFAGSTGISLLTNLLILRNLAPNQLRYWILAVTITAFVAVVLQATQFRVELDMQKGTPNQGLKTSARAKLATRCWLSFTLLTFLILIFFSSQELLFVWMYSLLMVPAVFLSFFLQGHFQNASRQLSGMTLSLAISMAFIALIGVSVRFGFLNLGLLLIGNLLITSLFTLLVLKRFKLYRIVRWLEFSDLRYIAFYSLFWILCMIDIPVVAFFSVEINQSHYSAASTYGKFAFICTQFLLYFKLPEIRQASSFLQILKYALRIALLSLIPIVILSITPSNIQSLLFTEQYEAVPYIALLQSFALFPYLVSMALVQLLITRHAVRSVVLLLGLCLIFPISFLIFQPSSMGTVLLQLSLGIVLLLFLSLEVRKLLKLKIRKDSVVGEVVFVVGTTAEMIKIAPVVQGIHSAQIWNLSQQKFDVLSYIPAYFGKHNFVVRTREGDALQAGFKSFTWLFESVRFLIAQIMSNRSSGPSGRNSLLIVVHGDTLTAGLTAITSKILGLKVAHIEAGLRSHNLRHPFPEELIRILISRFADIHFCPTAEDLANIRKRNTRKILTNGNTFLNSFIPIAQKVLSEGKMSGQNLFRNRPFVLIHLHRLEFIKRNKLVVDTFAEISKLNTRFDLVLVLDPHLESVLQKLQLLESVHSCMNVLGKQSRENFTRLVWNAEFVITDSGGTQEELGYLGIPALIHRVATERSDGLGENISLSKWNISSIDKFSKEYKRFKKPCTSTVCDPTGVILSILRKSDVNDS